ncbi:DUF3617 domain-containing protein [Sphingomonas changnyeongensis]
MLAATLLGPALASAMPPVRDAVLPRLAVLGRIQPGLWALRDREPDGRTRQQCIVDPDMFVQLAHPGPRCQRFVIDDQPVTGTVHYSCPGAGHGRTTIRLETPALIQIDSQGVTAGAPFSMAVEGRRLGDCPAAGRRRR